MLKVLLTIDTEAHAINEDWQRDHLARDIERDIYGRIGHGRIGYGRSGERSVGLDYQLGVLDRLGLKAVFMVESLFSAVPEIGPEPLREIIAKIRKGGHGLEGHTGCGFRSKSWNSATIPEWLFRASTRLNTSRKPLSF